MQRKTPNNACRAELGQYPLLITIQKRAIQFWKHLKNSDPHSYHYDALKCQELSPEKSPPNQLVLRLSSLTPTNTIQPQDSPIPINPITINQLVLRLSSLTPTNTIQPQDSPIPINPITINQLVLRLSSLTPTNNIQPQDSPIPINPIRINQLALRLSSLTPTNTIQPQDSPIPINPITINQALTQQKQNHITQWETQTQTQSKLACYLALCVYNCKVFYFNVLMS